MYHLLRIDHKIETNMINLIKEGANKIKFGNGKRNGWKIVYMPWTGNLKIENMSCLKTEFRLRAFSNFFYGSEHSSIYPQKQEIKNNKSF